jgi:hypothetical protein
MQTGIWITYSDSMHFSEQLSYKIYFILSYGLKDIKFARFTRILPFKKKTQYVLETFLTEELLVTEADCGSRH